MNLMFRHSKPFLAAVSLPSSKRLVALSLPKLLLLSSLSPFNFFSCPTVCLSVNTQQLQRRHITSQEIDARVEALIENAKKSAANDAAVTIAHSVKKRNEKNFHNETLKGIDVDVQTIKQPEQNIVTTRKSRQQSSSSLTATRSKGTKPVLSDFATRDDNYSIQEPGTIFTSGKGFSFPLSNSSTSFSSSRDLKTIRNSASAAQWVTDVSVYDCYDQPISIEDAIYADQGVSELDNYEFFFNTYNNSGKICSTFEDLKPHLRPLVAERLTGLCRSRIHWSQLTKIQSVAIPLIQQGRDVCLIAPTASGKTLSYLIPAVDKVARELESEGSPGNKIESIVAFRTRKGYMCKDCELDTCAHVVCPVTGCPHKQRSESGDIEAALREADMVEHAEKSKHKANMIRDLRGVTAPKVVIIAPSFMLVEQIKNIAKAIAPLHVKIGYLCKSSDMEFNRRMLLSFDKCDLLVATPGKVVGALNEKKISLTDTRMVVVDEISSMLEAVPFEDLQMVLKKTGGRGSSGRAQIVFCGSSYPYGARGSIRLSLLDRRHRLILGDLNFKDAHSGVASRTIRHTVFMLSTLEKMSKLQSLIESDQIDLHQHRTLIFCNSYSTVEYVYERLRASLNALNIPVMRLHNKMTTEAQRTSLVALQKGVTTCLITTDQVSRGIDFHKVVNVVNYNMPVDFETWINRVGRCGRQGNPGFSFSFFSTENARLAKPLYSYLKRYHQAAPVKLGEYAQRDAQQLLLSSPVYTAKMVNADGVGGMLGRTLPRYEHLENVRNMRLSNGQPLI